MPLARVEQYRFVHAGVKKSEWPKYMTDIFRILKPGVGWLQCAEAGGHVFVEPLPEDYVLPQVIVLAYYLTCSSGNMPIGCLMLLIHTLQTTKNLSDTFARRALLTSV